ncbi:mitochondrial folate carrier protein Flx1 [Diaporthe helianthi]|uniref:Mitochondrial folate carrier protein Flx1 n=1 Tax=Diaporthe helianthi TaxID=158607 RepID=A0A2P5IFL4_DIAHE|nr:mitochondrial folate carrier protein Flx1 [Diaporthe helianthi]
MEKRNGVAKSRVDGIAGFTAGVVTTMIFHPLDVIKTRLQVNVQPTTGPTKPRPLSTWDVFQTFMKAKNPVSAAYRGLPINVVANSASWACFFHFKDVFEGVISARGDELTPGEQLASGGRPTALGYFVASGLSGITTSFITNPLWLLRTRMTSTDRHKAEAYPSMRVGALQVYRGEGLGGFYKGLGTSLLGTSHGAIQFAMYESLRNARLLKQQQQRQRQQQQQQVDEAGGGGGSSSTTTDQKLSNEANVVISTVSKTTAALATFPHQVIRNRLQNQRDTTLYGKGITGVVRRMWQEGGIRPFYRGIVPSVLRTLPATWVTFLVVENVRYYLPRWLDNTEGSVFRE